MATRDEIMKAVIRVLRRAVPGVRIIKGDSVMTCDWEGDGCQGNAVFRIIGEDSDDEAVETSLCRACVAPAIESHLSNGGSIEELELVD